VAGMELPGDLRVRKALAVAMKRLARRPLFSAEIERDLLSREYSEPEVKDVLSFLWKHRLLDDQKTALSLVESHSGRRSVGKGKLRAELIRRGAPEDTIESCIEGQTDDDELEAMRQALESKRWPANSRPRAARFLISRGFDEDLVESALITFFGDE
jgi:SOS response regulatory protein OraA/RecX